MTNTISSTNSIGNSIASGSTSGTSMLLTVENVLSIAEAVLRAPEEIILSKRTDGGIEDGVLSEIESKRLIFDSLTFEDRADFQTRANMLRNKMVQDLRVPLTVAQVDLIDTDVTAALSRYSLRGISRLTGIR